MNLCRPRAVKELLDRHGLKPSKSLGQNFLVDAHCLDKIIAAAEISPSDTVVEIGPGLGTLTRALAERGADVLAIEKDRKLQPLLTETLAGLPVRLTVADALTIDYRQLLRDVAARPKVVANLPYYVTTPLILSLLRSGIAWERLVLLVQREVVQRVMARPGQKAYGLLSIAVQYYTCPSLVTVVPPGAFYPPPQVSSAVVRLLPLDAGKRLHVDAAILFQTAQAALGQRRKTLLNALEAGLGLPRPRVQQAIAALGWPVDRRGETLSVDELVALTNFLYSQ